MGWNESLNQEEIKKKYIYDESIVDVLKTNKKVICLIEKSQDIELFTFLKTINSNNLSLVAVSPAVAWELEKKSIPHKLLNEYFDISCECKAGLDNFSKVDKICRAIDCLFSDVSPVFDKYSFKASTKIFCYIKNFYDGIIYRINILKSIIDIERPDIIITVKDKKNFFTDVNESLFYPFSPDDSIFSLILDLDGWSCKSVQIIRKSMEKCLNESKSKQLIQSSLKKIFHRNENLYLFWYVTNTLGFRKALSIFYFSTINRNTQQKKLMITSHSRDWQGVLIDLYRNGYQVSVLISSEIEISETNKLPLLDLKDTRIDTYCNHKGIDFSSLFIDKILLLLNRVACRFVNYIPYAESIIRKKSLVACIGSIEVNFEQIFFVSIAQHQNIPKITWQLGAIGYSETPLHVYEELIGSNIYFVYGKGVQEMYRNYTVDTQCKIIPMGSLILKELYTQKKLPGKKSRILFGTTCYYGNNLFFGYEHKIDDISLWHTQREIITFLATTNHLVFLKLHPGEMEDQHIKDFINLNKFNNITVYKREHSFCDLLGEADIIILDSPSTMLLEAIAMHKTIFVLLNFIKISEPAKELLKKRVYCIEDVNELKVLLKKFLNNEPTGQTPDIYNLEFLEYYGFTRGEKPISERVIEVLESLN